MELGRTEGKSTTRAHYYKDLLMEFDEGTRVRAVSAILDELESVDALAVSEIRKLPGGRNTCSSSKYSVRGVERRSPELPNSRR